MRSDGAAQSQAIARAFEGNLTATLYLAGDGSDDAAAAALVPLLRKRVGRLIAYRMPTGVAVSPAMNHGSPYPATSHPLHLGRHARRDPASPPLCYDNVPDRLLPPLLRDANPTGAGAGRQPWSREARRRVSAQIGHLDQESALAGLRQWRSPRRRFPATSTRRA